MEGTTILKDLQLPDLYFKENEDAVYQQKVNNFISKYGQFQYIVTATVSGVLLIVDGASIYQALKAAGKTAARTWHIGTLSRKQYLLARLLLCGGTVRPNYIAIAEAMQELGETERDLTQVANETHITYTDAKRYRELLTFDWDKYLKEEPNKNIDLFNYI